MPSRSDLVPSLVIEQAGVRPGGGDSMTDIVVRVGTSIHSPLTELTLRITGPDDQNPTAGLVSRGVDQIRFRFTGRLGDPKAGVSVWARNENGSSDTVFTVISRSRPR